MKIGSDAPADKPSPVLWRVSGSDMLCVPTTLLLHTTREGDHHDWLLGDPASGPGRGTGRLWTARVAPPSWAWAESGRFAVTPLPPHRPCYLRYEGPISGDRGHVRRVDAGYAWVLRWRTGPGGGGVLVVRMAHFAGWVEVAPLDADRRWEARVLRVDALPADSP